MSKLPQFFEKNYQEMRERIKLPSDDTIKGSINFGKFIEYFTTRKKKAGETQYFYCSVVCGTIEDAPICF